MKFTPEVIAAIQTLRDNTENDFERRRIDVLERDLTAPPQVEVIDDKHQRFNGIIYREDNNGHFSMTKRTIHRDVWQYYHGEIPIGHVIHHIDENKANNFIENLQCMSLQNHRSLHNQLIPQKKCVCLYCGEIFTTKFKSNFCSTPCREAWRYRNDRVPRVCPVCGQTFDAPKRRNQECCSVDCANKLKKERANLNTKPKYCQYCGKELTGRKRWQTFCSCHCSMKYRHKKD